MNTINTVIHTTGCGTEILSPMPSIETIKAFIQSRTFGKPEALQVYNLDRDIQGWKDSAATTKSEHCKQMYEIYIWLAVEKKKEIRETETGLI